MTFGKLKDLLYDLLSIEVWKDKVFPNVKKAIVDGNCTMRGYFCLYHEATITNLFEIIFFHKHAVESLGDDLMELVDFCARKIQHLVYVSSNREKMMPSMSTKELAKVMESNSPEQELERQAQEIDFNVAVVAMTMLRYICENIDALPLCVISRVFDTHDILLQLVPLIENPPWTRRRKDGKWEKLVDQKWEIVEPSELLKITKLEGQMWIALYHLTCSKVCRDRYHFNTFRKDQLLRVRKFLNDVMLDQLPILADVQRFMDELTIMKAPEPTAGTKSAIMLEQIPQIRQSMIKGHDWKKFSETQITEIFSKSKDQGNDDLKRMANLYCMDGIEEILGEPPVRSHTSSNAENVTLRVFNNASREILVHEYEFEYTGNEKTEETSQGTFRRCTLKLVCQENEIVPLQIPFDASVAIIASFGDDLTEEIQCENIELPAQDINESHGETVSDSVCRDPGVPVDTNLPRKVWKKLKHPSNSLAVQALFIRQEHADPQFSRDGKLDCYGLGSSLFMYHPMPK